MNLQKLYESLPQAERDIFNFEKKIVEPKFYRFLKVKPKRFTFYLLPRYGQIWIDQDKSR